MSKTIRKAKGFPKQYKRINRKSLAQSLTESAMDVVAGSTGSESVLEDGGYEEMKSEMISALEDALEKELQSWQ